MKDGDDLPFHYGALDCGICYLLLSKLTITLDVLYTKHL